MNIDVSNIVSSLAINWVISVAIILFAGIFQIRSFRKTQRIRKTYIGVFPDNPEDNLHTYQDNETAIVQIEANQESIKHNKIFDEIVNAINNYLLKNRGATDFSILKDITDRNCDAVESQIEATAPIPIYIGLCGTLVGIVFGIAILGFGGGIDALTDFSSSNYHPVQEIVIDSSAISDAQEPIIEDISHVQGHLAASGISNLLSGVGVAMITTLLGVILTIIGSAYSKKVYEQGEKRKNNFLSWMQGELLPQMNSSMENTLDILQRNLTSFNNSFAENSRNLSHVFDGLNTSYQEQAEVLKLVENMKINDIATANVKVLKELQKCTAQISVLQEFVNQSNQYLSSVESLNQNLSQQYERTLLIEKMGEFFMSEIQDIEQRKAAISESVGKIDLQLQSVFKDLEEHTALEYNNLKSASAKEYFAFLDAVEAQKKALEAKLSETTTIVAELKNLVDVKESIGVLVAKSDEQNARIEQLIESNNTIASISTTQNGLLEALRTAIDGISIHVPQPVIEANYPKHLKLPLAFSIIGILTCTVVIGTCALFLIQNIL